MDSDLTSETNTKFSWFQKSSIALVIFFVVPFASGWSLFQQRFQIASEIPSVQVIDDTNDLALVLTLKDGVVEKEISGPISVELVFFSAQENEKVIRSPINVSFAKYFLEKIKSPAIIQDLAAGPLTIDGASTKLTLTDSNNPNALQKLLSKNFDAAILRIEVGQKKYLRIIYPMFKQSIKFLDKSLVNETENPSKRDSNSILTLPLKFFDFTVSDTTEMEVHAENYKRKFDQVWSQCGIKAVVTDFYSHLAKQKIQIASDVGALLSPEIILALRILQSTKSRGLPVVALNNSIAGVVIARGIAITKDQIDFSYFNSELRQLNNGFIIQDGRDTNLNTLSHEVGHIILNQLHDKEDDHLMSDGAKGVNISPEQCKRARAFIEKTFPLDQTDANNSNTSN